MIVAQVVFGLIPSAFMVLMSIGLLMVGTSWEAIVFPCAVAGTAGLGWAILGYEQRSAKWVLLLLVIGELTMPRALIPVLLQLVYGHRQLWKVALGLLLTLAPFTVGAIHIVASGKQVIQSRAKN